jgi:hypothetical protein
VSQPEAEGLNQAPSVQGFTLLHTKEEGHGNDVGIQRKDNLLNPEKKV